jgi:hypothetical protein
MTTLINLTSRDPKYGYESIQPPRRNGRNKNTEQAERIWKLMDRVVEYRTENCKDGDLEASVLAIAINKLVYAARHCEAGEITMALNYLADAKFVALYDDLSDEIEALAKDMIGDPRVCGCVLPEQKCPVCESGFLDSLFDEVKS